MADIDDAEAALGQARDQREQAFHLDRRERRRRFVEQQHACLQRDRLCNLDHLANRDRSLCQGLAHIERNAEIAEQRARVLFQPLPVDQSESRGRTSGEDVLADADGSGERKLLEDRGNAEKLGVTRRTNGDRVAVDADRAGIRLKNPGENIGQRRFAGAVLADQRMDLSRQECERHRVEGDGRTEVLGNACRRQEGGHQTAARRTGDLSAAAMSVTPAE